MTLPPPVNQSPAHRSPARPRAAQPRATAVQSDRLPPAVSPSPTEVSAPTLLQYWRSDSRVVPGRSPAAWAGKTATALGLPSMFLFFGGLLFEVPLLTQIAFPLSSVAFVFGLIAVVAGIGRGIGSFGLFLAIISNALFWAWLALVFG